MKKNRRFQGVVDCHWYSRDIYFKHKDRKSYNLSKNISKFLKLLKGKKVQIKIEEIE